MKRREQYEKFRKESDEKKDIKRGAKVSGVHQKVIALTWKCYIRLDSELRYSC